MKKTAKAPNGREVRIVLIRRPFPIYRFSVL